MQEVERGTRWRTGKARIGEEAKEEDFDEKDERRS